MERKNRKKDFQKTKINHMLSQYNAQRRIEGVPGVQRVDYRGIDNISKGRPGFQWGKYDVSGRVQVKYVTPTGTHVFMVHMTQQAYNSRTLSLGY